MQQYNPEMLNRIVAPGIAVFTAADIPDLRAEFPQSEHWLSNHYLNTVLGPNYVGPFRQYAINMLCRAQAQFAFFHQAREKTVLYIEKSPMHNPAVRHYYAAIVLWESCLLNYQMFIDLHTKAVGKLAFAPGDGSEEQRAYDIANAVKHWGGVINSKSRKDDHTIPLSLSNEGFRSNEHHLTYIELAAITREVAKVADELENPGAP